MRARYSTRSPALNIGPKSSRGATLIVAMVLLLLLTLLGLQSLNNVSLQERMAAGTQDLLRAFHTAESGLSSAATQLAALANTTTTVTGASQQFIIASLGGANRITGANFVIRPLGETPPPPGSGFAEGTATAFHFETISTAFGEATFDTTNDVFDGFDDSAVVQLHGGAYQIGGIQGANQGSLNTNTQGYVP